MSAVCDERCTETNGGLGERLHGRVVVLGIGNALRGDDGIGPLLAGRLARRTTARCINAGISAERYLGKIIEERPDTLLIIDAMALGREPGAFALVEAKEIPDERLIAHGATVRSVCEALAGRVQARILVLGIQPHTFELGSGVSPGVRRSLRLLEEEIVRAIEVGRR